MTQLANDELWAVFDARRVKMPELKGLDAFVNRGVGWAKNRRPVLSKLKALAARVEKLEAEIHHLGNERFREEVSKIREVARMGYRTILAIVDIWVCIDERRLIMQEMNGLDALVNRGVGCAKNRRPVLSKLKALAARVEKLEPEIHHLGNERFREEVSKIRDEARM